MNPFSILMLTFAAALLLYAAILWKTKDSRLIVFDFLLQVRDKKAYTLQFAKVVAIVAAAPALSGVTALWNITAAEIVFIAAVFACIWPGMRIMKSVF